MYTALWKLVSFACGIEGSNTTWSSWNISIITCSHNSAPNTDQKHIAFHSANACPAFYRRTYWRPKTLSIAWLPMSSFYQTGKAHMNNCLCDIILYWVVLVRSSAQLLEPFRLNHDIQLISGGAGILSGSAGVADLDRAPGAPATGIVPGTLAVGPTTELEDPPGLYEKVGEMLPAFVVATYGGNVFTLFLYRWSTCCQSG